MQFIPSTMAAAAASGLSPLQLQVRQNICGLMPAHNYSQNQSQVHNHFLRLKRCFINLHTTPLIIHKWVYTHSKASGSVSLMPVPLLIRCEMNCKDKNTFHQQTVILVFILSIPKCYFLIKVIVRKSANVVSTQWVIWELQSQLVLAV